MKRNKNHIRFNKVITLGILLILIILNVFIYTKFQSSRWYTYLSPDRSFTFKYPASWKLKETDYFVSTGCSAYGGDIIPGKHCSLEYNLGGISISTPKNRKSLDEIFSTLSETGEMGGVRTTFRDDEAIRSIYPGSPQSGGSYLNYYINHNNKIYLITMAYRDLFKADSYSDFPKPNPDIISTFKFLDN